MMLRSVLDRIHSRGRAGLYAGLGSLALATGIVLLGLAVSEPGSAEMARTKAPEGARVYFISPKNGATLKSPVVVRFGLEGMGVAPSGVEKENTGHHHLLVDTELPPMGLPVPNDEHHRHFGGGQTEVNLDLAPGKHTLQLLLADQNHVPHDPPVVSKRITITVR